MRLLAFIFFALLFAGAVASISGGIVLLAASSEWPPFGLLGVGAILGGWCLAIGAVDNLPYTP